METKREREGKEVTIRTRHYGERDLLQGKVGMGASRDSSTSLSPLLALVKGTEAALPHALVSRSS